jgi:hypothetical protein
MNARRPQQRGGDARRRPAGAGVPGASAARRLPELDRRALLAGGGIGAAMMLAACTGHATNKDASPGARPSNTGTAVAPRRRINRPEAPLPVPRPWPVRQSEVMPEVKLAAIRTLEALCRWADGEGGADAAVDRLPGRHVDRSQAPHLVAQARPLLGDYTEGAVRVVGTQYGGLLDDSASVIVALRQWKRGSDGRIGRGGGTVDVRVARNGRHWSVTDLRPSRPGPPSKPEPRLVRRTLDHPGIRLPPAARADLLAGSLCDLGMRAMLALADRYDLAVTVVHSGHPYYVFGTDRISDHTRMRAFDVWAIDRRPIVARSTPHRLVETFMRDAVAAGAYNVGGPRQLDGPEFFSDATHHDHTHIAFDR